MTSQHNKPKRWRPWQFSLAALLVCMTATAILLVWRVFAIGFTVGLAAGIWLGLLSPVAVVVSGVLLAIVVSLVNRMHRNDARAVCGKNHLTRN